MNRLSVSDSLLQRLGFTVGRIQKSWKTPQKTFKNRDSEIGLLKYQEIQQTRIPHIAIKIETPTIRVLTNSAAPLQSRVRRTFGVSNFTSSSILCESQIMADQKATNVTWHEQNVSTEERQRLNGHKGAVLWFTGLSGCGKSTVANAVDRILHDQGIHTYVLDGDNIRLGLNQNLSFSADDRTENIRRIGEVAKLFCDSGAIVLTAFISPFKTDRDQVREIVPTGSFHEVFVDASLETCEARDPKGLYQKARAGEIKDFTGIDSPYEAPENAELHLDSDVKGIEELANQVVAYLKTEGFLNA